MRVNALFQLQGLVYEKTNSFLTIKATQLVPMNVADQFNQRSRTESEIKAGASERAGFMEAPEIKDKKKNQDRFTGMKAYAKRSLHSNYVII